MKMFLIEKLNIIERLLTNSTSFEKIFSIFTILFGYLYGKQKWELKRTKAEVKGNEIDNEIKLIEVLKQEIKDLNDKIDVFEKKQDELYKKITKLQDENLEMHRKLVECLKR